MQSFGAPIGNKPLCSLHFADDQLVIAQDDREYITWKLQEEYEALSLTLNLTKQNICQTGNTNTISLSKERALYNTVIFINICG